MKVEMWADIMCPWCYIGKARLDRALAAVDRRHEVETVWRSFELRPQQPRVPGATLGEMMRRRFSLSTDRTSDLFERIRALGAEEGLDIRLDGLRPVNSFDAQRLIHRAAGSGLAGRLADRLFRGYFTEHLNVADHAVLLRLATDAGLDPATVRKVLGSDAHAADVRRDERQAGERGVTSVPAVFVEEVPVGEGVPTVAELTDALKAG